MTRLKSDMTNSKDNAAAQHDSGLQLLDVFLESITDLSSRASDRNEFYQTLAKNILPAADAAGTLIAVIFPDSRSTILQSVFRSAAKQDESACRKLICNFPATNSEVDEPSFLGHESLASGLDCFIAQCSSPSNVNLRFLIARPHTESESLDQVFGDLAEEIARMIQAFEEKWAIRQIESKSKSANDFAKMTLNIASSRTRRELSFHLANDLNHFVESDRVCLFDSQGRIKACNGVSTISRKSQSIRELSAVARSAIKQNRCLEYRANAATNLSHRDQKTFQRLAQNSRIQSLVLMPLVHDRRRLGAVSFEFFDDIQSDWLEQRTRIQYCTQAIQPVLSQQKQLAAVPFLGFWIWFFNEVFRRPIRYAISLTLIITALLVGFLLLSTLQTTFEITATGQLQPSHQRNVFASARGTIEQVYVDEGDHVDQGQQTILIRSIDLETEISNSKGELAEAHQRLTNLQLQEFDDQSNGSAVNRADISSQIETQKIRLATLEKKLEFLERKSATLSIDAPMSGQIVSRDLKQGFQDKPVEQGDMLYTIAEIDAPWKIELEIDEGYNAYLVEQLEENNDGLDVRFRVSSDPSKVFAGKLKKLNYIDKQRTSANGKRFVNAEIEFDKDELGELLRIGTGVTARIDCGQRSYLFLMTYELKEKIRSWFFLGSLH